MDDHTTPELDRLHRRWLDLKRRDRFFHTLTFGDYCERPSDYDGFSRVRLTWYRHLTQNRVQKQLAGCTIKIQLN
jgi:hypothetical protein